MGRDDFSKASSFGYCASQGTYYYGYKIRNYAKGTKGLFAKVIEKISALTIFQYANKINNKPIGQIKYALI